MGNFRQTISKILFLFIYCSAFSGLSCKHVENSSIANNPVKRTEKVPTDSESDGGVADSWDAPKNIVLFIGDGMGKNHVAAAGMYKNGKPGTLFFESFPVHGSVMTRSANNEITDSAASATAMACGVKVNNGVIAKEYPGSGRDLFSLVDYFKHQKKSTGLVTTTHLTHATPAAFAAHSDSRNDLSEIAWHYLNTGRPEILFGGGGNGIRRADAEKAGYKVIGSLDNLIDLLPSNTYFIAGLFGEGHYPYEASGEEFKRPHLYESAPAAVQLLSRTPEGFFIMIEGGLIDLASHSNRIELMIGETVAFEQAVINVTEKVSLDETLIIVTADHGTGDMKITENKGKGNLPYVTWETKGHDANNVDIFVTGKGSDAFSNRLSENNGVIDNTEIFHLLTQPDNKDQ